jgi:lipopolysaccharide export system permease protein
VTPGQFQSSADGSRVFFIERDSQDSRTGRNVFVLSRTNDVEAVTSSRSGRIELEGDDRFLVLERGQRNEENAKTGEKTLSRFDTYRVLAGERALAGVDALPPKAMSTLALLRQPSARAQGELTWRLGLVLGCANMLLLAVGLSATNPRRASNWNLLLALLGFVVYYNVINLSQAWVAGAKVAMGPALLMSHGGALAVALLLLWWRESGNSRLRLVPRRSAA